VGLFRDLSILSKIVSMKFLNQRFLTAFFLLLLVSLSGLSQDQIKVPKLETRVTDLTGTLTTEEITVLEQKLEGYEKEKGSQIAILLLPTTGEEEIEQFSIRVADEWKIGRKGTNDGVIIILAKEDRKARIEVAYGLEGALPDATSKRIIEETMIPNFKSGSYFDGLMQGTDAIIKVISGEPLPEPDHDIHESQDSESGWMIGLFIFAMIVRAIKPGFIGGLIVAAVSFLAGWIFFEIAKGIFFGILSIIVMIFMHGKGGGGGGVYRRGGSSWSSGIGGSSGGFSGGGGSFGGGGASGSW
jgi:uncharacterized protein